MIPVLNLIFAALALLSLALLLWQWLAARRFLLHKRAANPAFTPAITLLNLDFSTRTDPPAVALTFPQDGLKVSGTKFTLDGFVDDPTATVAAQIVDAGGNTNVASGEVERTGRFWVDDLPLNAGANLLTLTVTDAAGHSSVTNIGVIQSTVTLTMDSPTDPSQLWHPAMDVSGTISVSGYAVSVNGIAATVSGNAWSAPNVPVPPGGVASFTALAISGGQTNANKSSPAKPDLGIIIQSDMQAATNHTDARREFWDVWNDGTCDETWGTNELAQHWTNGLGGSASSTVASDFWVGDWGLPIPGQWNMTRDPDYPGILLEGWLFPATNSVPYANYDRGLGAVPYGFSVNAPLGCEILRGANQLHNEDNFRRRPGGGYFLPHLQAERADDDDAGERGPGDAGAADLAPDYGMGEAHPG